MKTLIEIIIILTTGTSIAIADALIKKSAIQASSLLGTLKNPLILIASLLYLLQIVLYDYVFVKR